MSDNAGHGLADLVGETKIHRHVYTDPAVFQAELKHIWYRTWLLVGHESEIPEPGDFKTTYLGRKPVILCRGEDNQIRVFLNTCRHRGVMVCRERHGNAKTFTCMYHAWSYGLDGTLLALPSEEAFGPDFSKEDFRLFEVPRVASYRGIVFASLNADVPPLEQHLGNCLPYIDLALGANEGAEVIGIHEYEYRGNWKLHGENTIDGYHPAYLHRFFRNAGMWTEGEAKDLGNGHGMLLWNTVQATGKAAKLFGVDASEASLDTSRVMVIYPNAVLVHIQDLINLRMVIPIAHDRTKVFATALGLMGEPAETRTRRAIQLSAAQGPAGLAGADDIEVFEAAQEGFLADGEDLNWLDMSRGAASSAVGKLDDDTAIRGCYREWRRLMASA